MSLLSNAIRNGDRLQALRLQMAAQLLAAYLTAAYRGPVPSTPDAVLDEMLDTMDRLIERADERLCGGPK